jgi:hypothetical protein
MAQMEKRLNYHANTPAAIKMNEINPKYENTRKIHRLITNQNPGFLYKMQFAKTYYTSLLSRDSNRQLHSEYFFFTFIRKVA